MRQALRSAACNAQHRTWSQLRHTLKTPGGVLPQPPSTHSSPTESYCRGNPVGKGRSPWEETLSREQCSYHIRTQPSPRAGVLVPGIGPTADVETRNPGYGSPGGCAKLCPARLSLYGSSCRSPRTACDWRGFFAREEGGEESGEWGGEVQMDRALATLKKRCRDNKSLSLI